MKPSEPVQSNSVIPVHVGLPHDIYAHIIDHFASSSGLKCNDMKSLSLTHRSFVYLCQKHIFKEVPHKGGTFMQFLKLCDVSPHLVDHVRVLRLTLALIGDTEVGNDPNAQGLFLSKFRYLHELYLYGYVGASWTSTMCPVVSTAIINLLRSQPNLHTLHLEYISDFPALQAFSGLGACTPYLENLTISAVRMSPVYTLSDGNAESVESVRLKSCDIDTCTSPNFQTLFGKPDATSRPPFFDATALERVYVEWMDPADIKLTKRPLGLTKNLRELRCNIPEEFPMELTFKGVAEAILGCPSHGLIKGIGFSVASPYFENQGEFAYDLDEELLNLSGKLDALESLELKILISTEGRRPLMAQRTCQIVKRQSNVYMDILSQNNAFPAMTKLSIYLKVFLRNCVEEDAAGYEVVTMLRETAIRVERDCQDAISALSRVDFSFVLDIETFMAVGSY